MEGTRMSSRAYILIVAVALGVEAHLALVAGNVLTAALFTIATSLAFAVVLADLVVRSSR